MGNDKCVATKLLYDTVYLDELLVKVFVEYEVETQAILALIVLEDVHLDDDRDLLSNLVLYVVALDLRVKYREEELLWIFNREGFLLEFLRNKTKSRLPGRSARPRCCA